MADKAEGNEGPGSAYRVSEKVPLNKLLSQDANDASLQAYKKSLGLTGEVYSPPNDPRRVVILELRIVIEGRPQDIVYTLKNESDVKHLKDKPFVLREGCKYQIKISFRVQHEIVSGLKYVNQIFRKGLRVAKEDEMIGSFAPQEKPHIVTVPRNGWEEAPSGTLSRGSYSAKSSFVDDDKQSHLEYEYAFAIKKDWDEK